MSSSQSPSSALSYLEGCPPGFEAQADVLFVVEGRELPVHSHFLGRSCRFFADLFSSLAEAPAGRRGSSAKGATAAASPAAPLRLEEPFRGTQLAHVQLFLSSLYRPAEVTAFARSPELCNLPAFYGVFELADRLHCELLLGALRARLASWETAVERMLGKDPLGWIEFADRFDIASLRGRCVSMLLAQLADGYQGRQLVKALDWGRADQRLCQQLLEGLLSSAYTQQGASFEAACADMESGSYCSYCDASGDNYCRYCSRQYIVKSATMFADLRTHLPSASALAAWSAMGDVLFK